LSRKSEHPIQAGLQIAIYAIIKSGLSEVAYAYPSAARVGRAIMNQPFASRRSFLKLAGTVAAAELLHPTLAASDSVTMRTAADELTENASPDYTLRIAAAPIELAS
jgi:hypothetical protein